MPPTNNPQDNNLSSNGIFSNLFMKYRDIKFNDGFIQGFISGVITQLILTSIFSRQSSGNKIILI
jgi:hypothetical protein